MTTRRSVNVTYAMTHPNWEVVEEWEGVTVGDVIRVRGESGVFRFVNHTTTEKGATWVTAIGGTKHHKEFRSFRPERVRALGRRTAR